MGRSFSTVELAVETIAKGGVVIVLDAWDRENEGDFLAAAETITAEAIHFMITYGRGHLCQPILPATAKRIDVQPLVPSRDPTAPRFAMPVDDVRCKTGISPIDRAMTIQSIVDPASQAGDFIRPGHIFPLIAQDGGVLQRQGHTEAATDLTRMAGLAPSGVLCEICSRDGRQMAELDELIQLADEFSLPIVTIDSLVEFRQDSGEDFHIAELAQGLADELSAATSGNAENRAAQATRQPELKDS